MYSENLRVVPILFTNKCNVDDYGDLEIIPNYEIYLCVYCSKYFSVVARKISLKGSKFLKN
jgi:hypothetical protein